MKLAVLIFGFLAVCTKAMPPGGLFPSVESMASATASASDTISRTMSGQGLDMTPFTDALKNVDLPTFMHAIEEIHNQLSSVEGLVPQNKETANQVLDGMIGALTGFKDAGGLDTANIGLLLQSLGIRDELLTQIIEHIVIFLNHCMDKMLDILIRFQESGEWDRIDVLLLEILRGLYQVIAEHSLPFDRGFILTLGEHLFSGQRPWDSIPSTLSSVNDGDRTSLQTVPQWPEETIEGPSYINDYPLQYPGDIEPPELFGQNPTEQNPVIESFGQQPCPNLIQQNPDFIEEFPEILPGQNRVKETPSFIEEVSGPLPSQNSVHQNLGVIGTPEPHSWQQSSNDHTIATSTAIAKSSDGPKGDSASAIAGSTVTRQPEPQNYNPGFKDEVPETLPGQTPLQRNPSFTEEFPRTLPGQNPVQQKPGFKKEFPETFPGQNPTEQYPGAIATPEPHSGPQSSNDQTIATSTAIAKSSDGPEGDSASAIAGSTVTRQPEPQNYNPGFKDEVPETLPGQTPLQRNPSFTEEFPRTLPGQNPVQQNPEFMNEVTETFPGQNPTEQYPGAIATPEPHSGPQSSNDQTIATSTAIAKSSDRPEGDSASAIAGSTVTRQPEPQNYNPGLKDEVPETLPGQTPLQRNPSFTEGFPRTLPGQNPVRQKPVFNKEFPETFPGQNPTEQYTGAIATPEPHSGPQSSNDQTIATSTAIAKSSDGPEGDSASAIAGSTVTRQPEPQNYNPGFKDEVPETLPGQTPLQRNPSFTEGFPRTLPGQNPVRQKPGFKKEFPEPFPGQNPTEQYPGAIATPEPHSGPQSSNDQTIATSTAIAKSSEGPEGDSASAIAGSTVTRQPEPQNYNPGFKDEVPETLPGQTPLQRNPSFTEGFPRTLPGQNPVRQKPGFKKEFPETFPGQNPTEQYPFAIATPEPHSGPQSSNDQTIATSTAIAKSSEGPEGDSASAIAGSTVTRQPEPQNYNPGFKDEVPETLPGQTPLQRNPSFTEEFPRTLPGQNPVQQKPGFKKEFPETFPGQNPTEQYPGAIATPEPHSGPQSSNDQTIATSTAIAKSSDGPEGDSASAIAGSTVTRQPEPQSYNPGFKDEVPETLPGQTPLQRDPSFTEGFPRTLPGQNPVRQKPGFKKEFPETFPGQNPTEQYPGAIATPEPHSGPQSSNDQTIATSTAIAKSSEGPEGDSASAIAGSTVTRQPKPQNYNPGFKDEVPETLPGQTPLQRNPSFTEGFPRTLPGQNPVRQKPGFKKEFPETFPGQNPTEQYPGAIATPEPHSGPQSSNDQTIATSTAIAKSSEGPEGDSASAIAGSTVTRQPEPQNYNPGFKDEVPETLPGQTPLQRDPSFTEGFPRTLPGQNPVRQKPGFKKEFPETFPGQNPTEQYPGAIATPEPHSGPQSSNDQTIATSTAIAKSSDGPEGDSASAIAGSTVTRQPEPQNYNPGFKDEVPETLPGQTPLQRNPSFTEEFPRTLPGQNPVQQNPEFMNEVTETFPGQNPTEQYPGAIATPEPHSGPQSSNDQTIATSTAIAKSSEGPEGDSASAIAGSTVTRQPKPQNYNPGFKDEVPETLPGQTPLQRNPSFTEGFPRTLPGQNPVRQKPGFKKEFPETFPGQNPTEQYPGAIATPEPHSGPQSSNDQTIATSTAIAKSSEGPEGDSASAIAGSTVTRQQEPQNYNPGFKDEVPETLPGQTPLQRNPSFTEGFPRTLPGQNPVRQKPGFKKEFPETFPGQNPTEQYPFAIATPEPHSGPQSSNDQTIATSTAIAKSSEGPEGDSASAIAGSTVTRQPEPQNYNPGFKDEVPETLPGQTPLQRNPSFTEGFPRTLPGQNPVRQKPGFKKEFPETFPGQNPTEQYPGAIATPEPHSGPQSSNDQTIATSTAIAKSSEGPEGDSASAIAGSTVTRQPEPQNYNPGFKDEVPETLPGQTPLQRNPSFTEGFPRTLPGQNPVRQKPGFKKEFPETFPGQNPTEQYPGAIATPEPHSGPQSSNDQTIAASTAIAKSSEGPEGDSASAIAGSTVTRQPEPQNYNPGFKDEVPETLPGQTPLQRNPSFTEGFPRTLPGQNPVRQKPGFKKEFPETFPGQNPTEQYPGAIATPEPHSGPQSSNDQTIATSTAIAKSSEGPEGDSASAIAGSTVTRQPEPQNYNPGFKDEVPETLPGQTPLQRNPSFTEEFPRTLPGQNPVRQKPGFKKEFPETFPGQNPTEKYPGAIATPEPHSGPQSSNDQTIATSTAIAKSSDGPEGDSASAIAGSTVTRQPEPQNYNPGFKDEVPETLPGQTPLQRNPSFTEGFPRTLPGQNPVRQKPGFKKEFPEPFPGQNPTEQYPGAIATPEPHSGPQSSNDQTIATSTAIAKSSEGPEGDSASAIAGSTVTRQPEPQNYNPGFKDEVPETLPGQTPLQRNPSFTEGFPRTLPGQNPVRQKPGFKKEFPETFPGQNPTEKYPGAIATPEPHSGPQSSNDQTIATSTAIAKSSEGPEGGSASAIAGSTVTRQPEPQNYNSGFKDEVPETLPGQTPLQRNPSFTEGFPRTLPGQNPVRQKPGFKKEFPETFPGQNPTEQYPGAIATPEPHSGPQSSNDQTIATSTAIAKSSEGPEGDSASAIAGSTVTRQPEPQNYNPGFKDEVPETLPGQTPLQRNPSFTEGFPRTLPGQNPVRQKPGFKKEFPETFPGQNPTEQYPGAIATPEPHSGPQSSNDQTIATSTAIAKSSEGPEGDSASAIAGSTVTRQPEPQNYNPGFKDEVPETLPGQTPLQRNPSFTEGFPRTLPGQNPVRQKPGFKKEFPETFPGQNPTEQYPGAIATPEPHSGPQSSNDQTIATSTAIAKSSEGPEGDSASAIAGSTVTRQPEPQNYNPGFKDEVPETLPGQTPLQRNPSFTEGFPRTLPGQNPVRQKPVFNKEFPETFPGQNPTEQYPGAIATPEPHSGPQSSNDQTIATSTAIAKSSEGPEGDSASAIAGSTVTRQPEPQNYNPGFKDEVPETLPGQTPLQRNPSFTEGFPRTLPGQNPVQQKPGFKKEFPETFPGQNPTEQYPGVIVTPEPHSGPQSSNDQTIATSTAIAKSSYGPKGDSASAIAASTVRRQPEPQNYNPGFKDEVPETLPGQTPLQRNPSFTEEFPRTLPGQNPVQQNPGFKKEFPETFPGQNPTEQYPGAIATPEPHSGPQSSNDQTIATSTAIAKSSDGPEGDSASAIAGSTVTRQPEPQNYNPGFKDEVPETLPGQTPLQRNPSFTEEFPRTLPGQNPVRQKPGFKKEFPETFPGQNPTEQYPGAIATPEPHSGPQSSNDQTIATSTGIAKSSDGPKGDSASAIAGSTVTSQPEPHSYKPGFIKENPVILPGRHPIQHKPRGLETRRRLPDLSPIRQNPGILGIPITSYDNPIQSTINPSVHHSSSITPESNVFVPHSGPGNLNNNPNPYSGPRATTISSASINDGPHGSMPPARSAFNSGGYPVKTGNHRLPIGHIGIPSRPNKPTTNRVPAINSDTFGVRPWETYDRPHGHHPNNNYDLHYPQNGQRISNRPYPTPYESVPANVKTIEGPRRRIDGGIPRSDYQYPQNRPYATTHYDIPQEVPIENRPDLSRRLIGNPIIPEGPGGYFNAASAADGSADTRTDDTYYDRPNYRIGIPNDHRIDNINPGSNVVPVINSGLFEGPVESFFDGSDGNYDHVVPSYILNGPGNTNRRPVPYGISQGDYAAPNLNKHSYLINSEELATLLENAPPDHRFHLSKTENGVIVKEDDNKEFVLPEVDDLADIEGTVKILEPSKFPIVTRGNRRFADVNYELGKKK